MKLKKLRKDAVVTSQKAQKITALAPEQLESVVRGGLCIYILHSSDPK